MRRPREFEKPCLKTINMLKQSVKIETVFAYRMASFQTYRQFSNKVERDVTGAHQKAGTAVLSEIPAFLVCVENYCASVTDTDTVPTTSKPNLALT